MSSGAFPWERGSGPLSSLNLEISVYLSSVHAVGGNAIRATGVICLSHKCIHVHKHNIVYIHCVYGVYVLSYVLM